MPTSPHPFTTPNAQLQTNLPNLITQFPSGSNSASRTEHSGNGPEVLSSVCADSAYCPAIQIYDDGLTCQAPVTVSTKSIMLQTAHMFTKKTANNNTTVQLYKYCFLIII